jgi:hypothetical protein
VTVAGLVQVEGEDVIVEGYHLESEARYQNARVNGGKGGKATQRRRANAASPNAAGSPRPQSAESLDKATSGAQAALKRRLSDKGEEGEGEKGNGSEGLEREGNGSECTETGGTPPPDDAPPPEDDGAPDCAADNSHSTVPITTTAVMICLNGDASGT